jgi:hypothetical protein
MEYKAIVDREKYGKTIDGTPTMTYDGFWTTDINKAWQEAFDNFESFNLDYIVINKNGESQEYEA